MKTSVFEATLNTFYLRFMAEKISNARDKFISGDLLDISQSIDPELLESWKRSHEYGVPFAGVPDIPLAPASIYVNDENKAVIETTHHLIKAFNHTAPHDNFITYLTDREGIILYVACGNTKLASYVQALRLCDGAIWNERTCGTIGHTMCAHMLQPYVMLGVGNYNHLPEEAGFADWWNKRLTISAPILLDSSGKFFHTLNIAMTQDDTTLPVFFGSFLVTAQQIADEVNHRYRLNMIYQALESTQIALVDLDMDLKIVKCNAKGKEFLCALSDCTDVDLILGKHITEVLGQNKFFESILEARERVYDREITFTDINRKVFFNAIFPAIHITGEQYGYILSVDPDKNKKLDKEPVAPQGFDLIIGDSLSTRNTIVLAEKVSKNRANVLLTGESGVGKEVYARAIHDSNRPGKPFIAVNCAAIPSTLLVSEFFGYERGSFTGADRQGRPGKIEQANGGTLFLDEIGDMPLDLQTVLLRVLEDRKVVRIGGQQSIPVDFRLISATNKDMEELIAKKLFREDLYYRIAVFTINIPPLRCRKEDIIPLAEFFLEKLAAEADRIPPKLDQMAKSALLKYNWPGNIRQLKNVIEYAYCMAEADMISFEDLPVNIQRASGNALDKSECTPKIKRYDLPIRSVWNKNSRHSSASLKEAEKRAISEALLKCDNKVCDAAGMLGISKSTLYRKIKEYHILEIDRALKKSSK